MGLLGFSQARDRGRQRHFGVILDAVIAALAILAVAWVYVIDPVLFHSDTPLAVRLVLTCYPAMSIFLVVVTVRRGLGGLGRRDVVDDVRPLVRAVDVLGPLEHGVSLHLELATQPSSVRPDEVVAALGDVVATWILRTRQLIERGGARLEPLEADPRPRALEVRAS